MIRPVYLFLSLAMMNNGITAVPELKDSAADFANSFPTSAEMTSSLVSAGVTAFISGAGLLWNLVVILVICLLEDYKKTTHWYVLNLAVADSIFLIMLPFNIAQVFFEKWAFGIPLCAMFHGAFYLSYYAGVLFLAVLSFDRYVAIEHPVSYVWGRIRSSTGSRLISISVWSVAIAAAVPLMVNTTVDNGVCDFSFETLHPACEKHKIFSINQCQIWLNAQNSDGVTLGKTESGVSSGEDTSGKISFDYLYSLIGEDIPGEAAVPSDFTLPERHPGIDYNCQHQNSIEYLTWVVGNFVLSFVLPLSVMACCYGGILWRIQHPKVPPSGHIVSKTRIQSPMGKSGSSGIDKKVRITVLVVSLVAVFILCWTPYHVVVLAKIPGMQLSSEGCARLKNAAVVVAYSNSLLNPVMYSFLGSDFAKRLRKAGRRILGRHSPAKTKFVRNRGEGITVPATKATKSVNVRMHQIVTTASKLSKHDHSQKGYATESGHVLTIANDIGRVDPSERMLGERAKD